MVSIENMLVLEYCEQHLNYLIKLQKRIKRKCILPYAAASKPIKLSFAKTFQTILDQTLPDAV